MKTAHEPTYSFVILTLVLIVVNTIIATNPVLILPAAILLDRERVSPRAWVGAVIAVAGVAWLVL